MTRATGSELGLDALTIDALTVDFDGKLALRGIDLRVRAGEVHALIGHNGSGKSTAVKVLAGAVQPLSGCVVAGERNLAFGDPRSSMQAGLRFVHQDLRLVEGLDAVDNVALANGYDRVGRRGPIRWPRLRGDILQTLRDFSFSGDPRTVVSNLGPVDRLVVALVRAVGYLGSDVRVVALDEITAALPVSEVAKLLTLTRTLADRGIAVIYISHYLDEVLEVADRVTVLREGSVAASITRDTTLTTEDLVGLMFGEVEKKSRRGRDASSVPGGPERSHRFSAVEGLRLDGVLVDVAPGEIVGVYGLDGSGREELASVLVGSTGRCQLLAPGRRARRATLSLNARAGVALVPRDRARQGCIPTASVSENIVLAAQRKSRRWFVTRGMDRRHTETVLGLVGLHNVSVDAPFATLSGGMQQRALIARALAGSPAVLILDEPSQGVDVGARAEIHRLVTDACSQHRLAALVISTDAEELSVLADRVLVLRAGRIAAELTGADVNEHNMVRHASAA
jgi:ribose transport system ATP-binding protein